jgi:hypothetical protein
MALAALVLHLVPSSSSLSVSSRTLLSLCPLARALERLVFSAHGIFFERIVVPACISEAYKLVSSLPYMFNAKSLAMML